jgi:ornithine cyclodeaminase/alanine dehydrogenase-like protein (mu-crystallin family)
MDSFLATDPFGGVADPVDQLVERMLTGQGSLVCPSVWQVPGRTGPERTRVTPAAHGAVLTALAARFLLPPAPVTASVLGPSGRLLAALCRYLPGISHVAVYPPGRETVATELVEELESAGIGVSIARSVRDAVFGANLVVVTDRDGAADLDSMHVSRGALLVNATGRDLPDAVVDRVDRIFIDDPGLLAPAARNGLCRPARAAVHPSPLYRLTGDLRQVLTGQFAGRVSHDDVLLVELLTLAVAGTTTHQRVPSEDASHREDSHAGRTGDQTVHRHRVRAGSRG